MILCSGSLARCQCVFEAGHNDDHTCDCGGRWDAQGKPTRLPMQFEDGRPLPFGFAGMTRTEFKAAIGDNG